MESEINNKLDVKSSGASVTQERMAEAFMLGKSLIAAYLYHFLLLKNNPARCDGTCL